MKAQDNGYDLAFTCMELFQLFSHAAAAFNNLASSLATTRISCVICHPGLDK